MTARDQAAFNAGIQAAIAMARAAAVTLELRGDAVEVRQNAAAAALQGLGDGLKAAFLDKPTQEQA